MVAKEFCNMSLRLFSPICSSQTALATYQQRCDMAFSELDIFELQSVIYGENQSILINNQDDKLIYGLGLHMNKEIRPSQ